MNAFNEICKIMQTNQQVTPPPPPPLHLLSDCTGFGHTPRRKVIARGIKSLLIAVVLLFSFGSSPAFATVSSLGATVSEGYKVTVTWTRSTNAATFQVASYTASTGGVGVVTQNLSLTVAGALCVGSSDRNCTYTYDSLRTGGTYYVGVIEKTSGGANIGTTAARVSYATTSTQRTPTVIQTIDNISLMVGGTATDTEDVSDNFSDNGTLSYGAVSSNTAVATVAVTGVNVTVTALAVATTSTATITVTATDTGETPLSVSTTYTVTVSPAAAPAKPTTAAYNTATGRVDLAWNKPTGAISFKIYRGSTSTVATTDVIHSPTAAQANCGSDNTCTYAVPRVNTLDNIFNLIRQGTHYFVIVATYTAGDSPASPVSDAVIVPPIAIPSDLAVNRIGDTNNVRITFTLPFGTEIFNIRGSHTRTIGSTGFVDALACSPSLEGDKSCELTVSNLPSGTASFDIGFSDVVNIYVRTTISITLSAPEAPAKPTTAAYNAATGRVDLAWNKPTGATSFKIYRGSTSTVATTDVIHSPTAAQANCGSDNTCTYAVPRVNTLDNIFNLIRQGTHYFVIVATYTAGDSPASPVSDAVIVPPIAIPSDLAVNRIGDTNNVRITFTLPFGTEIFNIRGSHTRTIGSAGFVGALACSPSLEGDKSCELTVSNLSPGTASFDIGFSDVVNRFVRTTISINIPEQTTEIGTLTATITVAPNPAAEDGRITASAISVEDPDGDAGTLGATLWQISSNGTDGWAQAPGTANALIYQIPTDQFVVGKYLRFRQSYNSGGGVAFSDRIGPIANVEDEATGITISGAVVGSPSRIVVTDPDGAASATAAQWQTCTSATAGCSNIAAPLGTAVTYTPMVADVGKYLKVINVSTRDGFDGTTTGLDSGNAILISALDLEQVAKVALPQITRAAATSITDVISARASESSSGGLWGAVEHQSLSGEGDDLKWGGNLSGFHVGNDYRANTHSLIGFVASRQQGDFAIRTASKSEYELHINTLSAYLNRQVNGFNFIGSLGYGKGEGELSAESSDSKTSHDLTTRNLSLTVNKDAQSIGNVNFRTKSNLLYSETAVEERGKSDQDLSVGRVRIGAEGKRQAHKLASGASLVPSFEGALRFDFGDGENDGGMELGGGIRYENSTAQVIVEGKVRGLVSYDDDYEEWGVHANVRVQPGADGQGLQLTLSPSYGQADSGVEALWKDGLANNATDTTDSYKMRVDTRLGYGITLHRHDGLLTPYSESRIGGNNRYRVGVNWKPLVSSGNAFDLDLMGEQSGNDNRYLLRGTVGF